MDSKQDTIPFPDEIAHLEKINSNLDSALAEAEANVERIDKNYMDMKRYMADYRGEIDPHEMFQNELGLKQIDKTGAFAVQVRDRLAKLKYSPYFARIDFCQAAESEAENYYIGKFAFSHENQLLILDWRSPVAGMFYDHEVGPAGYVAPTGKVDGELTRKRQFIIKEGVMKSVLESSVNIQDNILQQELAHTSDEKMKSIIATIQKEQNQIIRNEKADTLIIQGVAGSGKTSIALHRIAFLLYRLKDRLSARNITILSPNKVFGDYISNVLPELGEEPVYEVSFEDIAEIQLEGVIRYEPDKDPLEISDAAWMERVRYKSTLDFVKQLDEFIKRLPQFVFEAGSYSYGRFTADEAMITNRFLAYGKYPVKRRLQMIAEDIYDRFATKNITDDDLPKINTIIKALKQMLKIKDTLTLYKEFYKQIHKTDLFVMPDKKTLEWSDVYPFLYIYATFEGLRESDVIKHLVVDEMQDYTPVQYAVLNVMFKCQKTILGDFDQFVNPNHLHTLEDLKWLYKDCEVVELSKSYRSTFEIISFAKQIKRNDSIEVVERYGEPPEVIECTDHDDVIKRIRNEIEAFAKTGYASLGIITKNNRDAKQLYELMSESYDDVHLISPDSSRFVNGVSITSVAMSKGLEFDMVIIPGVDSGSYHTEYDKSLLYIACTRAMHRLMLLSAGERSLLLAG